MIFQQEENSSRFFVVQWNYLKCFTSVESWVPSKRTRNYKQLCIPSLVCMNKKRIKLYDILYLLFLKWIYLFSVLRHKENYFLFFFFPLHSSLSFVFFRCRSFRHTKFLFFIMFPGYFQRLLSCFTHMNKYSTLASSTKGK